MSRMTASQRWQPPPEVMAANPDTVAVFELQHMVPEDKVGCAIYNQDAHFLFKQQC